MCHARLFVVVVYKLVNCIHGDKCTELAHHCPSLTHEIIYYRIKSLPSSWAAAFFTENCSCYGVACIPIPPPLSPQFFVLPTL